MSEMMLTVHFQENCLAAVAQTLLPGEAQSVRFALSDQMAIRSVRINERSVRWHDAGPAALPFVSPCRWYEAAADEPAHSLEICYSGLPVGWHNHMDASVRAFSLYSGWYPRCGSLDEYPQGEMIVLSAKDWLLLKGKWNEERGEWRYDGCQYDPFNLIMYRRDRLHVCSSPYLRVYCADETMLPAAEMYAHVYSDVLSFYNGVLYPRREVSLMDMPCLYPASADDGAYFRREMIVLSRVADQPLKASALNAHELAHQWCSGAQTDCWEDWLNETTAEWSALLYALRKEDSELFDYILKPHLALAPDLPAIRTADGSRPEGVHTKGTVLFLEIYQQYGENAIKALLRLFVSLATKTTECFLAGIRESVSREIADFIEVRLDRA